MIAKLVQVIETVERRGCGHTSSRPCTADGWEPDHRHEPIRVVTQYFDLEGNLLAERDPCPELASR